MNEDFFANEYQRFFIGLISEMDFSSMVNLITMKYAAHFSYIFPAKICKKQMLFGLNCLCLFKRISISIRRKIANGFLDGKVRSAETFHSRKYHQFYNKKKK